MCTVLRGVGGLTGGTTPPFSAGGPLRTDFGGASTLLFSVELASLSGGAGGNGVRP
jgi:hypothetical protein